MGSDPTLETGAEPVRNAVGQPNPGGHGPGLIANGGRPDACVIQRKGAFVLGALPQTPEILRFTARIHWAPGRDALDPGESRPPSRRSGCVSAEPYPPLGCNQYSRFETSTKRKCLHKILDTAGHQYGILVQHAPYSASSSS